MKMIAKITFSVLSMCIALPVFAQDITQQKIQWTATSVTEVKSNTTESNASQFVTSPDQIKWIQKDGQRVYTFSISQKVGTWPNVNQDGSITFQVSLNNKPGSVRIEKKAGVITLTLIYRPDEATGIHMKYQISSFEIINP